MRKGVVRGTGLEHALGGLRGACGRASSHAGGAAGDCARGRATAGSGCAPAEEAAGAVEMPSAACPYCLGTNVSVTDGGVFCRNCRIWFPRARTGEGRWHFYVSGDRGTWPPHSGAFNVAVRRR